MDAERVRAYLLQLPHTCETVQWGGALVLWVGDKAVGGKMFALIDLEGDFGVMISFAANGERSAELKEREGLIPAPYLARAGWVAATRWGALRDDEWKSVLAEAYSHVLSRLPKRTRDLLELPKEEQRAAVLSARAQLGAGGRKPPRQAKQPAGAGKVPGRTARPKRNHQAKS